MRGGMDTEACTGSQRPQRPIYGRAGRCPSPGRYRRARRARRSHPSSSTATAATRAPLRPEFWRRGRRHRRHIPEWSRRTDQGYGLGTVQVARFQCIRSSDAAVKRRGEVM
jgi:hypothetical protein